MVALWILSPCLFLLTLLIRGMPHEFSCSHATDCTGCLGSRSCGWCSEPLRRLNGSWLPKQQCFRDVDYGPELLCFGQISWEPECVTGWVCNETTGECAESTVPGTGTTFDHCRGSCGCQKKGKCDRFRCRNGTNDLFFCELDDSGDETLEKCSSTCGVGAATPVPRGPGNCTPACTVACNPRLPNGLCCPQSQCGFDFVWNDFRCHPDGKYCQ
jgi:hypothetical protein